MGAFFQYLQSDPHIRRVLIAAAIFLGLGSYLGNWAASSGEFIIFTLAFYVVALAIRREEPIFSRQWQPSLLSLSFLLFIFIFSVAYFLEDYENPLRDAKKMRHQFLPLACLVYIPMRNCLIKNARSLVLIGGGAVLVSACLATLSGIIGHFTGLNPLLFSEQPYPGRIGGVYSMVMTYAYSMQFTFLLIAAAFFRRKELANYLRISASGKLTTILIVSGVITGIGIYLSFTRGAALGSAVGLCVLALALRSKLLYGMIGAVAVLGVILAFATGSRMFSEGVSESNAERASQWRASALVFLHQPITGIGYRQFGEQKPYLKEKFGLPVDHRTKDEEGNEVWVHYLSHAHNNYLETFATTGVFGGLALCFFVFFWFREVWRSDIMRSYFAPVIAAFALSGCFECTFFDSEIACYLMVLYVASQIGLIIELRGGNAGVKSPHTS